MDQCYEGLDLFLVPVLGPHLDLSLKYGEAGNSTENDIQIERDKTPQEDKNSNHACWDD